MNLENLRNDYLLASLDVKDVFENPIRQFEKWFGEATNSKVLEPNAMVLATTNNDKTPSARVVLLKSFDEAGFVFYTNYLSHKGEDMQQNQQVSLLFFWAELQRQVRIEGTVSKVTAQQSTQYFQSRPKESQIGAWVSQQSKVVSSRAELEEKFAQLQTQYANESVLPRPEHWGGYVVAPYKIEFWQGRASRLHDRLLYTITELNPKKWTIERLAP